MTWRDDPEWQRWIAARAFPPGADAMGVQAVAARDRELRRAIEADRATWPLGYMDAHYFYDRVWTLLSGTERTEPPYDPRTVPFAEGSAASVAERIEESGTERTGA